MICKFKPVNPVLLVASELCRDRKFGSVKNIVYLFYERSIPGIPAPQVKGIGPCVVGFESPRIFLSLPFSSHHFRPCWL